MGYQPAAYEIIQCDNTFFVVGMGIISEPFHTKKAAEKALKGLVVRRNYGPTVIARYDEYGNKL